MDYSFITIVCIELELGAGLPELATLLSGGDNGYVENLRWRELIS